METNAQAADKTAEDLIGPDPSLLIVDDDGPFLRRLARAMESRGFTVDVAESVAEGIAKSKVHPPPYAAADLRQGDGNGLDVLQAHPRVRQATTPIVLTGCGHSTNAVTSMKTGARRPPPNSPQAN